MVARSVAATDRIHGSRGSSQLPDDDGAWEPVDFIPKRVKDWRRLALAQLTLKRVKGYWSELGRYLQHVKARIKDLD